MKRSRLFLRRTLLLAMTLTIVSAVPAGAAGGELLSAVYAYDGTRNQYRDEDAQSIDQMFYAFAVFKNGRLSTAHWTNFAAFAAYIEKYPHIVPVLSIGGWGADGFSQAAATAEGRAAFVRDALALMEEHGFLGVDIDWEYPGSSAAGIGSSPDDRENYTLLLQALRDGLDGLAAADGTPRLLCVALSGSSWLIENLQCEQIGAIVDQVCLMTYDMQMPKLASHHTALYASDEKALSASENIGDYIAAGIPAEKILLGVAFYGHRWRTNNADPLYSQATYKNTLAYTQIKRQIDKNPAAVFYDEIAQAPYYADGRIFISYDDARSIVQKRQYAQDQGLLGLFAWQYGSDETGELVGAMKGEE